MNSKTMNIVLMVIIALILVVTVVIAVMTFNNHTLQPLPMNEEKNVESNETIENIVENEEVEKPENLQNLKNKGEIAKVRSVYTDENFKTVTVPAGYAIIKDSPNTNDGMVISDVADDDLDNSDNLLPVPSYTVPDNHRQLYNFQDIRQVFLPESGW